jgi:drug/metabolite transporter (DMT)-like permease
VSPAALALLLAAAVMHAGWNLLVQRAGERQAFLWWATVVSAAAAVPALAFAPPLPARALPYAAASATAEVAYFFTLAAAYGRGDFSLVYPVARGAAPALLALWAALFLGERPGPAGIAGLGLVVAGLIVLGSGASSGGASGARLAGVPAASPSTGRLALLPAGGFWAALAVAFFISAYSAIDGAAVRFAPALSYTLLIFALIPLLLTPPVLRRYGLARLAAEWRAHRAAIVVVGLGSFASYALVLAAFSIAPVTYAGAVREASVVLAALAGWLFLGEGFGRRRTAGALLVFAGILAIALAGR